MSSDTYGVQVFINVCRDIKFGTQVPADSCKDSKPSAACRKDIKKPIGKITASSKLYYEGNKIKLVYNYTEGKSAKCPHGVVTDITFFCQKHFSNVCILYYGIQCTVGCLAT